MATSRPTGKTSATSTSQAAVNSPRGSTTSAARPTSSSGGRPAVATPATTQKRTGTAAASPSSIKKQIPTSSPANLPDDVEALKTLLRAKDSEISTLQRLQEEAEGKLRDTQATWELKFAALSTSDRAKINDAEKSLATESSLLLSELRSSHAKCRIFESKLRELGVETSALIPDELKSATYSSDSKQDFESRLASLRETLKNKKDLLSSRLVSARALTERLKATLEAPGVAQQGEEIQTN